MKFHEYRREFERFHAAHEAAVAEGWRARNPLEPLPYPLHDRYSDLSSLSAVEMLRAEKTAAETRFEVERRAVDILLHFAESGFIDGQTREVDAEFAHAADRARVVWKEHDFPFLDAERSILRLGSTADRRAAHAVWHNALAGFVDLLAERSERRDEAARKLGATHVGDLRMKWTPLCGFDHAALHRQCTEFLRATEPRYTAAVFDWAKDHQLAPTSLERIDALPWRYLNEFDAAFPAGRLIPTSERLLRGLGIRTWDQPNLKIVQSGVTACVRRHLPDDIRLLYSVGKGWKQYRNVLGTTALAQRAAWTSRNLPYEVRAVGDAGITEVHRTLFADLVDDPNWLGTHLDLVATPGMRQAVWRARVWSLRHAAAVFLCEHERQTSSGQRFATDDHAAKLTEATLFRHTKTETAYEMERPYGDRLRAAFFAAHLQDHLKSKFGAMWWTSTKAGDFLIDLWNTGYRYTLPELAAQIGFGDVGPEALVEEIVGGRW